MIKLKNLVTSLSGIIAIALLVMLVLTASQSLWSQPSNKLAEANFCFQASQCRLLAGLCPFECYVAVNQAKAELASRLMFEHSTDCLNICPEPPKVDCVNARCVLLAD